MRVRLEAKEIPAKYKGALDTPGPRPAARIDDVANMTLPAGCSAAQCVVVHNQPATAKNTWTQNHHTGATTSATETIMRRFYLAAYAPVALWVGQSPGGWPDHTSPAYIVLPDTETAAALAADDTIDFYPNGRGHSGMRITPLTEFEQLPADQTQGAGGTRTKAGAAFEAALGAARGPGTRAGAGTGAAGGAGGAGAAGAAGAGAAGAATGAAAGAAARWRTEAGAAVAEAAAGATAGMAAGTASGAAAGQRLSYTNPNAARDRMRDRGGFAGRGRGANSGGASILGSVPGATGTDREQAEAGAADTATHMAATLPNESQVQTRMRAELQSEVAKMTAAFTHALAEQLAPMKKMQKQAEKATAERFQKAEELRAEDTRLMQIAWDKQKADIRESKAKQEAEMAAQAKTTSELGSKAEMQTNMMAGILKSMEASKKESDAAAAAQAAQSAAQAAQAAAQADTMKQMLEMMGAMRTEKKEEPPPAAAGTGNADA